MATLPPEETTLTWGEVCAAIVDGKLPHIKLEDAYEVRGLDVLRLQRRKLWLRRQLGQRLDFARLDAGISA
jgi:hypothetical protein